MRGCGSWRAPLLGPECFWFESPQPTGYRVLVSISESRSEKSLKPIFTTNFGYKIDHISKTKYRKIVKLSAKFVSEHCASSGTKKTFFHAMSQKLEMAEIEKFIFHPFRTLCNFLDQKHNLATFDFYYWNQNSSSNSFS